MLFLQTYDQLSVWKVPNFPENLQTTIQHNQYYRDIAPKQLINDETKLNNNLDLDDEKYSCHKHNR